MNRENTQPKAEAAMDDIEFPSAEEARRYLAENSINTEPLKRRITSLLCLRMGHIWTLSWPLDPCEYTCSRCGEKRVH